MNKMVTSIVEDEQVNTIVAVITGDVIHSRRLGQEKWMPLLKSILGDFGESPTDWDVFRGDAFQVLISSPEKALAAAMKIKAGFKSQKGCDLRLAIGLGTVHTRSAGIGESNGDAFVRSGSLLDSLKSMHSTLAVTSPWPDLDKEWNASLALAAALMDKWLPNYAEVIYTSLCHPHLNQSELGRKLGIAQNTVSERQSRGNKKVLVDFEKVFSMRLKTELAMFRSMSC